MDRPVNYEQTDPRWGSKKYLSASIAESGCGPACAAMVIATLRDPDITPVETCAWSVAKEYRIPGKGTAYAYFLPQFRQYNIACDPYHQDADGAVEAVRQGYMVVALAKKGLWTSSGHFILAYGIDGDRILINDPNSRAISRERAPIATFKEQCKYFWIIREEWRMSYQQFKEYMDKYQAELGEAEPAAWSKEARTWAEKSGLITGSNGKMKYKQAVTREQMVVFMKRLWEMAK